MLPIYYIEMLISIHRMKYCKGFRLHDTGYNTDSNYHNIRYKILSVLNWVQYIWQPIEYFILHTEKLFIVKFSIIIFIFTKSHFFASDCLLNCVFICVI